MSHVTGVVPHPCGWLAVELRDGAFEWAMLAPRLCDIVAAGSGVAVIGVDVPLGVLPDRCRAVDALAADRLGSRRGNVFRVPPLAVWQEADFTAASKVCRELTGTGLGRQAWAVRAKLLEATALWERLPTLFHEIRAELSFRYLAGEPLAFSRTTWNGQATRRSLLAQAGIVVPDRIGPAGQAPPENILDAAAVAWSAHRVAAGTAQTLSSPSERHRDSPIAIWY